jgi:sec-independent protein translocase protein TatA
MFGSLGFPELFFIFVLALIIFGPRKLPELGKTLGEALGQFKRASEDFKRSWEEEVELEKRRPVEPKPAENTFAQTTEAATVDPPSESTVAAADTAHATLPSVREIAEERQEKATDSVA